MTVLRIIDLVLTAAMALSILTGCAGHTPGRAAVTEPLIPDAETDALETKQENTQMNAYDFSVFENVTITGADWSSLRDEELSVLYRQAEYCQAMTEADIDKLCEIVSKDMTFTHMSGRQQTREEYFSDIARGRLRYFTIGIENPSVKVDGDRASVTFTSVLNANAYGARGTFRMTGTHHYEMRDGEWIAVNR